MIGKRSSRDKRAGRVRYRLKQNGGGKPRLSVFRSGKNIYAQIIDDVKGVTLAAASTLDADAKKELKNGAGAEAAAFVGKTLAARAKEKGLAEVVFDRGAYQYHGRVRALAEAAREGGLKF